MLESSTYYLLDAQGNQLSVYKHVVDTATATVSYYLTERNIYGSSRLGMVKDTVNMQNPSILPSYGVLGNRKYALTNHLNNVLTVISDVVYPISSDNTTIDGYQVGINNTYDYSPFGVALDGRSFNTSKAKYGFNGMEKDNEVKGEGNSYTTKFRQYDPRLGRWLTLDPKMEKFPWQSPYVGFDNNPILKPDPTGGETEKTQGDYFTPSGEKLGSDGVDDHLKHTISKEDYNNNISLAAKPEVNKEILSKYVQSTQLLIEDKTINLNPIKNDKGITVAYQPDAEGANILRSFADGGALYSTAVGGLKYKELDITLTKLDLKALQGGKAIFKGLGAIGDVASFGFLVEDYVRDGATKDNLKKTGWFVGDLIAGRALSSGNPYVIAAGGVYYLVEFVVRGDLHLARPSNIEYSTPINPPDATKVVLPYSTKSKNVAP